GLRLLRDPVDEGDRLHERAELEVLEDLSAVESPAGEVTARQPHPDVLLGQPAHASDSSSTLARAFSRTSSPSESNPSWIVSGGSSRTTLSYVPAFKRITPCLHASSRRRVVAALAGALVSRSSASSIATMAPLPLTSPVHGTPSALS